MGNLPRDKKFYECGDWVDILAEKDLTDHPREVLRRFTRESIEDGYRWEYYRALEWMNETGPDWEDLTDEQRDNIRQHQREHAQAMQNFGKAIASGNSDAIDVAGKKLTGL
jgi:hypothetical protein